MKEKIDRQHLPEHIAIIMDGNGRWAKKNGLDRIFGHQQGVKTVHEITEAAAQLRIKYLTLYTFSTENWNRPQAEIEALMDLLVDTIRQETSTLMKNNVRLQAIGDLDRLPEITRRKFFECVDQTSKNTGLTLVIALSYSARWDLTHAVKQAVDQAIRGTIKAEEVNETFVSKLLTTSSIPDPDLLIRTSGELRISNFLLWELAYSELYFTPLLWPEFTKEDFYAAIVDFQGRERRYGKTSEQL